MPYKSRHGRKTFYGSQVYVTPEDERDDNLFEFNLYEEFPNGQNLLHFAAYEEYERKSINKLGAY